MKVAERKNPRSAENFKRIRCVSYRHKFSHPFLHILRAFSQSNHSKQTLSNIQDNRSSINSEKVQKSEEREMTP